MGIFIHGLDMNKCRQETQKLIGYVPYESNLDPWLTLRQNIIFNAKLFYIKFPDYSKNRIFFRKLNLTSNLEDFAYRVSGGEQKAMLIRALIHDPDVLIMDEPTGFMDAESIRITWDLTKI